MELRKGKTSKYLLYDTAVENVFINEYLKSAPGDFVKVYLLGLMHAELGLCVENEGLARDLDLAVEDVMKAWSYWDEKGVVRKLPADPADPLHYDVEFLPLREGIFGGGRRRKKSGAEALQNGLLTDESLRKLYADVERITGRVLGGKEPAEILRWMQDYGQPPELIAYAYAYCKEKRGKDSASYVGAVLRGWAEEGLKSLKQLEDYLEETDGRYAQHRRIFKALGFLRNPTEEERRLMDAWFDEMGLGMEDVLDACKKTAGISSPNIRYVDAVLRGRKEQQEGGGEKSSARALLQKVLRSYEQERKRREAEAEARRAAVYAALPRVAEIDREGSALLPAITMAMLGGKRGEGERLQKRYDALLAERERLLAEAGYQNNYTDIWYACPLCKDSGILDNGEHCVCLRERLAAAGKTL